MPFKDGGGNKQQPYDENTGKYTKGNETPKNRDYDSEIESLKAKTKGLSLFSPERRELNKQIEQLEAEKEGFSSYDELKQHRLEESNKKEEERQKRRLEQQNQAQSYMMSHRPTQSGITADNLINQDVETPMPDNFYEMLNKENDVATKESMQQLNRVRNNPDAEVTIYRATIGDTINEGDWITLSPTYANGHNQHSLGGKGKVLKMKVKAKDIQFAGDDIKEWGYFPKESNFEKGLKKGLNLK